MSAPPFSLALNINREEEEEEEEKKVFDLADKVLGILTVVRRPSHQGSSGSCVSVCVMPGLCIYSNRRRDRSVGRQKREAILFVLVCFFLQSDDIRNKQPVPIRWIDSKCKRSKGFLFSFHSLFGSEEIIERMTFPPFLNGKTQILRHSPERGGNLAL